MVTQRISVDGELKSRIALKESNSVTELPDNEGHFRSQGWAAKEKGVAPNKKKVQKEEAGVSETVITIILIFFRSSYLNIKVLIVIDIFACIAKRFTYKCFLYRKKNLNLRYKYLIPYI